MLDAMHTDSHVYLTFDRDLALSGAGVPRIVLRSGRSEPEAERSERAVRDTGADLTILRSTWFLQNFSEDYMREDVVSGEIRRPAGDVPTPFLDADDIAGIAVAALADDRHVGELYLFREFVDGRNADTTGGVRRALGREPRDFAQYAGDAVARGAWTAPRDAAA
jgi:uncharacterized protein YbjT (DUF2867 family)